VVALNVFALYGFGPEGGFCNY